MNKRRFMQLDVFGAAPLAGNPLAVVIDGDGLDDATMQSLARWTNLSETTFLLPATDPHADYRVRIFTPVTELPFAGHPTLGSAWAWLAAGGTPRRNEGDDAEVVQQCGIGNVRLRRDAGGRLAFAAPARRKSGPLDDATLLRLLRWLKLPRDDVLAHEWCDNGPQWAALLLRSADAVLALDPDLGAERDLCVGIVGAHAAGGDAAFEVRAFFPAGNRLAEDPVTGSLNAALGQWLIGAGIAPERYVAAQGTRICRRGRVRVERAGDGSVWVGGDVAPLIDGTIAL